MPRWRVTSSAREELLPAALLPVVHRQGGLQVEVQGAPVEQREDGGKLVLTGQVLGRRQGLKLIAGNVVSSALQRKPASIEGPWLSISIDPDGERCHITRDRFGQRDVYFSDRDAICIAASDLELIGTELAGELDDAALAHMFVAYGFRPPKQHTRHRGIRRLGVGERMEIHAGQLQLSGDSPPAAKTASYGQREHHEYADALLAAVEARGSSDGNVVYLSSGWDSTSILACLVHVFGARHVRAVIGRQLYSERSGVGNGFEMDRAAKIADYYGIPLHVTDLNYASPDEEALGWASLLLESHEVAGITALNHALLARAVAREGLGEVVFAGEVSDGAHNLGFSQYVTVFHESLEFREYADKMASYLFGPTFLGAIVDGRHELDPIWRMFTQDLEPARFERPRDNPEDRPMQLLSSFFLRDRRLPLWSLDNVAALTVEGRHRYGTEMEQQYLEPARSSLTQATLYSWYLRLYNSFHWQGSTVACFALAAEHAGLKPQMPFLDAHLQDFLASMPETWGRGLDLNPTKHPLKWVLRNVVDYPYHLQVGPHSYNYDVDPSFNHYIELLYHSGLRSRILKALESEAPVAALPEATFEASYLDGLVGRYRGGDELSGTALSDLAALIFLAQPAWSR